MRLTDDEFLLKVLKDLDEASKHHSIFVRKSEERYRAYRGMLAPSGRSRASRWRSNVHPRHAFQMVETLIANLIEERPRFQVKPRPKIGEDLTDLMLAAKTMEYLLRYEADQDHYAEKKRPFVLQSAITGLTIGKNYWAVEEGLRHGVKVESVPVFDDEDVYQGSFERLVETSEPDLRDGPTFEVVDVRDFLWHEAAVSLERSPYLIHRTWMTYGELERLNRFKGIEALKESRDFNDLHQDREQTLFHTRRNKDMIEVIEYWGDDGQVGTVGNRKVLLERKANSFHHGERPFVGASSMPDLFRIPGISEVEIVVELQDMLWSLTNQRFDNLELLNNAIIVAKPEVDLDAFVFAPGAKNVARPDDVEIWQPNPLSTEISLKAEELIRADIQNTTGGMPLLAGQESSTDNKTATGISIMTNLAQKRLMAKKSNYAWAEKRVGEMWISLCQQFVRGERMVEIVGQGKWLPVGVLDIQGQFSYEVSPATESLMRQERRAEAQTLLQVAMETQEMATSSGSPWNMRKIQARFLDAFDIDDPDGYIMQPPAPPALPSGGGLAGSEAPVPGEQAPAPGVTNTELATSDIGQNPTSMGQQMQARTGPVQ